MQWIIAMSSTTSYRWAGWRHVIVSLLAFCTQVEPVEGEEDEEEGNALDYQREDVHSDNEQPDVDDTARLNHM